MRYNLLFILFIISLQAGAQRLPDLGINKVRLTDGETVIQAELKPFSSNPEPANDRFYYWYGSNTVHATQGGFSGKLLHGSYVCYYANKAIKEMGQFKKGLKNGEWKSWDDSGHLRTAYTWNDGLKDGQFTVFDDQGKLKQKGNYSDDQMDGKVYTYNETGTPVITKYQHGLVEPPKAPSKFWQQINVFKSIHLPDKMHLFKKKQPKVKK